MAPTGNDRARLDEFRELKEAASPQGLEVSEAWYPASDLRARYVIRLLIIGVVVSEASLISTSFEIGLLGQMSRGNTVSRALAQASDSRHQALGIAGLVVFFLAGAAWLLWQHRAHSNLKVSGLRFTPGWAVGWWFIPFASLIKPYQAVRELRQASSGRPDWDQNAGWPLLGWWWAAWVALTVSGVLLYVLPQASVDDRLVRSYLSLAQAGVSAAAAVLAIVIVRSVDARQTEAAFGSEIDPATSVYPVRPLEPVGRFAERVLGGVLLVAITITAPAFAYVAGGRTSEKTSTLQERAVPTASPTPISPPASPPTIRPFKTLVPELTGNFDKGERPVKSFNYEWGTGHYADGGILFAVKDPSVALWAWAESQTTLTAISVEADVTRRAGPRASTSGGILALATESSGYQFEITHDGSYGLYKVLDSDAATAASAYSTLYVGDLTQRLRRINRLRIEVTGGGAAPTVVNAYVNDRLVVTRQDRDGFDAFTGVAFSVEADVSGAAVLFDNLVVREQ